MISLWLVFPLVVSVYTMQCLEMVTNSTKLVKYSRVRTSRADKLTRLTASVVGARKCTFDAMIGSKNGQFTLRRKIHKAGPICINMSTSETLFIFVL